jgi:hypothetical protein
VTGGTYHSRGHRLADESQKPNAKWVKHQHIVPPPNAGTVCCGNGWRCEWFEKKRTSFQHGVMILQCRWHADTLEQVRGVNNQLVALRSEDCLRFGADPERSERLMHEVEKYGGRFINDPGRQLCVQFMRKQAMDAWLARMRSAYTTDQFQPFVNDEALTVHY